MRIHFKTADKRITLQPENEDLTMHLSEVFIFWTAQHSLVRLKSGELAYLTKGFDHYESNRPVVNLRIAR
jgi:serine/threonine-protein kinase HipA